MKIKTVVFWILWVGNDLTSQTIREQNPDPASPPFFPSRLDDADLVSQTLGLTAPQKEQMQQLAEARRPQLETVRRQARDEEAAILKQLSDQVCPVLSAEQRTKLDALQNVVGRHPQRFRHDPHRYQLRVLTRRSA
jgi:hypothetical protein